MADHLYRFNDLPAKYRKGDNPHAQMCSWLVDAISPQIINQSKVLRSIQFQMGDIEIGAKDNDTLISIGLIPDDSVFVRFLIVFKVSSTGQDMLWNGVYNIAVLETKIIEKGQISIQDQPRRSVHNKEPDAPY